PRVPPLLYGFGTVEPPYDYTALLAILRNNSFMAIEIDGYVSIVPDQLARQFPTRIVQDDDPSIGSDERVTRILAVSENVNAVQLVPVMRPMQPQSAHLSAIASLNSLIIVDRYANVQRITEVVRMLEQRAAENGAAR